MRGFRGAGRGVEVVERVLRELRGLWTVEEGEGIASLMRIRECREADLEQVERLEQVDKSVLELVAKFGMVQRDEE